MDEEEVLTICKNIVEPSTRKKIESGEIDEPIIPYFGDWDNDFADKHAVVVWEDLDKTKNITSSKWLEKHGYATEFIELGQSNTEGFEGMIELDIRVRKHNGTDLFLSLVIPPR